MKCPFCGTWTDVAETRSAPDGKVRRARRCANGHSFATYESVANRARLLAIRNRQAVKLVLAGQTQTSVARQFCMPRSELSRYLTKHYPDHNGRSAGQVARWKTSKQ